MFLTLAALVVLSLTSSAVGQTVFETNIVFYGWNSNEWSHRFLFLWLWLTSILYSSRPNKRFVSTFATTMTQQGCSPTGNFAVVVHGYNETVNTGWVNATISNLLKYRGGCVFFMDYSKYAVVANYVDLFYNFNNISPVLQKKIKQIGNYDRLYLFGFSYGSRLAIDAGKKIGTQLISRMDLCDPASEWTRKWLEKHFFMLNFPLRSTFQPLRRPKTSSQECRVHQHEQRQGNVVLQLPPEL